MNYKKSQTYTEFMQMSVQQRKVYYEYFLKIRPDFIPVILQNLSQGQLPELKTCKFLINKNSQMSLQIAAIRQHLIKNSGNKIGKDDQLYFYNKGTLINMSLKAKDYYNSISKNLQDGWLVISYAKQATF